MSSIVVQHPDTPTHLYLLFHGVGSTPQSMTSLGQFIGSQFENAAIVSVEAPDASDFGQGFQWFSVQGVTEDNRQARIDKALPTFVETVTSWQAKFGLSREETTLIGFSQGSIMSLSATQNADYNLAANVVSMSGRFAQAPSVAPENTRIAFFHGHEDGVINITFAQEAFDVLKGLGADVYFQAFSNLGHTINQEEAEKLLAFLNDSL